MQSLFRASDVDGNGVLDRKELKACLLRPELGLSRKELNHLLSELKVDDANAVQYTTFVPLCFDILHQRLSEDLEGMSQVGGLGGFTPPSHFIPPQHLAFSMRNSRWNCKGKRRGGGNRNEWDAAVDSCFSPAWCAHPEAELWRKDTTLERKGRMSCRTATPSTN